MGAGLHRLRRDKDQGGPREQLADRRMEDKVEIVETGCLGPCSAGPSLMIGEVFYEKLQPEDAAEIVSEHLAKGRVVERLAHKRPDGRVVSNAAEMDFFKRQTKIVLRNCGIIDPQKIEDYIARDGYQALAKVLERNQPEAVIETLKTSGLRGRGGAGFPTWRKWSSRGRPPASQKYVVCNADEGDPGAFMDRSVLEGDPHSVIEGMTIAAHTIGASMGYIYVRAEYPLAVERLKIAIAAGAEARACWARTSWAAASPSTWRSAWARGPSSAAKRRRS